MEKRNDRFRNFQFRLEIDGIQQAAFSEVTGFDATVEAIGPHATIDPTDARKLPGLITYGNVTLKWGVTVSNELADWHQQIVTGTILRKSLSIVMVREDGKDGARWEVLEAWPSKYDPADINAKGNEVQIETLELVNEGVVRTKP